MQKSYKIQNCRKAVLLTEKQHHLQWSNTPTDVKAVAATVHFMPKCLRVGKITLSYCL